MTGYKFAALIGAVASFLGYLYDSYINNQKTAIDVLSQDELNFPEIKSLRSPTECGIYEDESFLRIPPPSFNELLKEKDMKEKYDRAEADIDSGRLTAHQAFNKYFGYTQVRWEYFSQAQEIQKQRKIKHGTNLQ